MEHKEIKDQQVFKERLELKVIKELMDHRVSKVLEHKEHREYKVLLVVEVEV
jgi:hypothetical protein